MNSFYQLIRTYLIRFLLILIFLININGVPTIAQDLIITQSQDSIYCKIINESRKRIVYEDFNEHVKNELKTSEIDSIWYSGHYSFTGDVIVRKNGEKIIGKIVRYDESNVYFITKVNKRDFETYILKSDIDSISYGNYTKLPLRPYQFTEFGIGLGINYGGIGVNMAFFPIKQVGVFVGLGYALFDIGYNAGVKIRPFDRFSRSPIVPHLLAMYGYTAIFESIDGSSSRMPEKKFHGCSLGGGFDIYPNFKKNRHFSLSIIFPLNNDEISAYMNELERNNVDFKRLPPVRISVGVKF